MTNVYDMLMFNPSLLGKAMLAQACLMEMKGGTTQLDEVTTRHGLDREFDGTTSECMSYYIGQLFSSYTKAYDYYNDMQGITGFGIQCNRTRERHCVT